MTFDASCDRDSTGSPALPTMGDLRNPESREGERNMGSWPEEKVLILSRASLFEGEEAGQGFNDRGLESILDSRRCGLG